MRVVVCVLLLATFRATAAATQPPPLPPGVSAEQLAWLRELGEARTDARRDALQGQRPDWATPSFVGAAEKALDTKVPHLAAAWLAAGRGLVAAADRSGDAALRARCRLRSARLAQACARWQEALGAYEQARALFEARGDKDGVARCYVGTGVVHRHTGRPGDALGMCEKARRIFEALGDKVGIAQCHLNASAAYGQTGRPAQALAALEKARALFEAAGDKSGVAGCYLSSGAVYGGTGRPAQALLMCEKARAIYEQAGDTGAVAKCYLNAGLVYQGTDRPLEALAALEKARALFEAAGDKGGVAGCCLSAGMVQSDRGRLAEALGMYEKARRIYEEMGDKSNVASCCLNAGLIYADTRRPEQALALYEKARTIYEKAGDKSGVALCHFSAGGVYRATGRAQQAAAAYRRALALVEDLRSQVADAELAASASFEVEALPAALAAVTAEAGRVEEAFAHAQRGKGMVVRRSLLGQRPPAVGLPPGDAARLAALHRAYETAEHRLARERDDPALRTRRDRALSELSAYEISLRARNPRWRRADVRPASLAECARALGPTRAALELLVDQDRVCLLLLTAPRGRPRLRGRLVALDRRKLEGWVRRYVEELQAKDPGDPEALRQLSRRLYAHLIQPVAAELAGITTLVICPDQFLHTLPFAALQDDKGRYLIERWALAVAPSTSAWEACRSVSGQRRGAKAGPPLLTAVSRFAGGPRLVANAAPADARGAGSLGDLPHARQEAGIVARAFRGRVTKLMEHEATPSAVGRAAPEAGLLHFATHALPNDAAPLMSALVLAPRGKGELGLLYARDVYAMRLRASLVVLSACGTTQGLATGGEGLIGLAWAFLVAGCPSTIATRWGVQDEAARRWVETFYQSYTAGKSKAESVRQACLRLIKTRRSSKNHASPHAWACWVLIGDDR